MLGAPAWTGALANDDAALKTIRKEIAAVLAEPKRTEWVHKKKASGFTRFWKDLSAAGLPDEATRVVAYSAVTGVYAPDQEFRVVGQDCVRGPLWLTHSQAADLGMSPIVPSVVLPQAVASDFDATTKAIQEGISELGDMELEAAEIMTTPIADTDSACVYLAGEDARTDTDALAAMVLQQWSQFPDESPLVKLAAIPDIELAVARAVAIPCAATLAGDDTSSLHVSLDQADCTALANAVAAP